APFTPPRVSCLIRPPSSSPTGGAHDSDRASFAGQWANRHDRSRALLWWSRCAPRNMDRLKLLDSGNLSARVVRGTIPEHMIESTFLSGKVLRRSLPIVQPASGSGAPSLKRLLLTQGELAQFDDCEEQRHYL